MTDISNKILGILVGISVIISVLGIFSTPQARFSIIGAATNETFGSTNVTIGAFTQIRLINDTVNFGSGFVNSSDTSNSCTLISNESTKTPACQGFNAPAIYPYFLVENVGNFNVSLDINGSFANPRSFLCEPSKPLQNCTLAQPQYNRSAEDHESGSCITGGSDVGTFGFNSGFSRVLNTSLQRICSNLDFNSAFNSIQVRIRIVVPRDSTQGSLNDTVVFLATS